MGRPWMTCDPQHPRLSSRMPGARAAAILALLAGAPLVNTACGGDGGGDAPIDTGDVNADAGGEADTGGDSTGPDAGPSGPRLNTPRHITIAMDPGRVSYARELKPKAVVTVFGLEGQPVEGALYSVRVEPDTAAQPDGNGRFVLLEEGYLTFTACAEEAGLDDAPVCASDTILVNDAPPTIVIDSPAPGAELDATTHPVVLIEGSVSDSFGEPVVYVNGKAVEIDVDGSFSTPLEARFGVNPIEVAASDGLHPDTTLRSLDVLWAPAYMPAVDADGAPAVSFEDGVTLQLGQNFVDDGNGVSTGVDGTIETKDLVDILHLVVRNLDLLSQLPDPVLDSGGITLRITGVDLGKPRIEGDLTDDGLEIYLQVSELIATTEGGMAVGDQSLDLDGSLSAIVSAYIHMQIEKASPEAAITVVVDEVEIAVEQANSQFASPEANAVFDLAQSALRDTIEGLLLDSLQAGFVDSIPGLLQDTLSALDTALQDESVEIDAGLGNPMTLKLDARVVALESAYRDRLSAQMRASAAVDAQAVFSQARGVPLLFPSLDAEPFFDARRVQVSMRLAFLNGVLHTLWNAGIAEADITSLVPDAVEAAQISAKLPPVIRPPLFGEPHDLVLEFGQIEITAQILGRTEVYGVGLSTGIDIAMGTDALTVEVADDPMIRTWIIASNTGELIMSPQALETMIRTEVWPELMEALSGGLSLPLPVPDISGLGSIAAPLSSLMLDFTPARPLAVRDGYIVVDALLLGTFAP